LRLVVNETTGPEEVGVAETVTPVNLCLLALVPMYTVPFSVPLQEVVVDVVVDDDVVVEDEEVVVDDDVVVDEEEVVVPSGV
jgi:hypothetical protein